MTLSVEVKYKGLVLIFLNRRRYRIIETKVQMALGITPSTVCSTGPQIQAAQPIISIKYSLQQR